MSTTEDTNQPADDKGKSNQPEAVLQAVDLVGKAVTHAAKATGRAVGNVAGEALDAVGESKTFNAVLDRYEGSKFKKLFSLRVRDIPQDPSKWDLSTMVPELEGLTTAEEIRAKVDETLDDWIGFIQEDMGGRIEAINQNCLKGEAPKAEEIMEILGDGGVLNTQLERLEVYTHLAKMEHHRDSDFHDLEEHVEERIDEVKYHLQSAPTNFRIPVAMLRPMVKEAPQMSPMMRVLAGLVKPEPYVSLSDQKAEKESGDEREADFSDLFGKLNSDKEFLALSEANKREMVEKLTDEERAELEKAGVTLDALKEEMEIDDSAEKAPKLSDEDKERIRERYQDTAMKMINGRFFQMWERTKQFGITPAVLASQMQGLPNDFVEQLIPQLPDIVDSEGFDAAIEQVRQGREKPETPPKYTEEVSWQKATDVVVEAFTKIHPHLGELAHDALADGWVHAENNKEKFYNPFSLGGQAASVWTGNHPVILMNFKGKADDVRTLAHEMGHAIAEYVSGFQAPMDSITSIALHETFAHFAANMATQTLVERTEDLESKTALKHWMYAHPTGIFHQEGMNNIEHALYEATAPGPDGKSPKLTRADVGNIWREQMKGLSQDPDKINEETMPNEAVIATLSRIPQIFAGGPPYYNTGYVLAEMGALQLEQRFKELEGDDRDQFAEKWLGVIANARKLDYGSAMRALDIEVETPDDMIETAKAMIKDRLVDYAKYSAALMYGDPLETEQKGAETQEETFLGRLKTARAEKKAAAVADAASSQEGDSPVASFISRFRTAREEDQESTKHASKQR